MRTSPTCECSQGKEISRTFTLASKEKKYPVSHTKAVQTGKVTLSDNSNLAPIRPSVPWSPLAPPQVGKPQGERGMVPVNSWFPVHGEVSNHEREKDFVHTYRVVGQGKMCVLDENRVYRHIANIPYSLDLVVERIPLLRGTPLWHPRVQKRAKRKALGFCCQVLFANSGRDDWI
jgi:hypothetical protein